VTAMTIAANVSIVTSTSTASIWVGSGSGAGRDMGHAPLRDGCEQAKSTGPVDGFHPAMGAELVIRVPPVRPDRVHRHMKLAGDLRHGRLVGKKRRTRAQAG